MTPSQRFYDIACTFPVMNSKGIKQGDIPGISRDRFSPDDLAGFVYEGPGRAFLTGSTWALP